TRNFSSSWRRTAEDVRPRVAPTERKKMGRAEARPNAMAWFVSAPRARVLRRYRDAHRLARVAGEAGEHGFDQVRHQVLQPVGGGGRLRFAFEQPLAVRGSVDLQLDATGVN